MPRGRYRQKTSFKDVDSLSCPHYEQLTNVTRCLHISDVEEAQRRGMLVPQPIRNSRALNSSTKVLWFAPTQSMEQHNFYGNVSYVINWKVVLAKMGPHLYLIDQAIYADHSFTRILLTKTNHDVRLQNANLHSDGSAIMKRSNNYVHAATCFCKNRSGLHELQIGIEVTDEDARWLYNHCTVLANNHSLANAPTNRVKTRKDGQIKKYAPFKCFLYNTTLNTLCPNQDTRTPTEATLASKNITFSRSLPSDSDMDADKENRHRNNRSYPVHGIGANTIKPKPSGATPPAVGVVVSSSSQPKIRSFSSHVTTAAALRNRSQFDETEQLKALLQRIPPASTTVCSAESNRAPSHRSNQLSPIPRTVALPTSSSGRTRQGVGRQVGYVHPLPSVSAYNSQPSSFRTPPSPNSTFVHDSLPCNSFSDHTNSTVSSAVTSPVRNDGSPIYAEVGNPIEVPEQPDRSFASRLRRWFMCCCWQLMSKVWRSALSVLSLCLISKVVFSTMKKLCSIESHSEALASLPSVVLKPRTKGNIFLGSFYILWVIKSIRPVLSFISHLRK